MKRGSVFLVSIFIAFMSVGGATSPLVSASSYKVCGSVAKGYARCNALVLNDSGAQPMVSGVPKGYGPADFQAAYGTKPSLAGHVGIVVAYDAPTLLHDVNVYSQQYGLPTMTSCTSARQNTCLEKISQSGGTNVPTANSGWALETSLDTESIHGQCPSCRISVVEANSSSMASLSAAVDTAAKTGASVVSNSYGGAESSGEAAQDSHYHKTGVTMVASSGDSGYGTNYPAASPYVLAVGGTSLSLKNGRLVSETAWNGAGSGCSLYEYKPVWQKDKKCTMRSIADIAADADPSTGAAIYDSTVTSGRSGWFVVGGTSLAAPLVSGIIAATRVPSNIPANLYTSPLLIRDVTSGSNGTCSTYLCRATVGYDGPTGLGVPSGL